VPTIPIATTENAVVSASRNHAVKCRWTALSVAAIAALAPAFAAPEGLPPAVLACLPLTDDAQRLACFDREIGHYQTAPAQHLGQTPNAWAAPAERAAAKPPKELTSKIAATATRPDGARQFTLENGQVWVQTHPEYIDGLKAGDGATIKTGMGGTFYLYNAHRYATQVRRVD